MHESKSFSSANLGFVHFVWIAFGKACQTATELGYASEKLSVWQSESALQFSSSIESLCAYV